MQKFYRVGATLYFLTDDGLSTSHKRQFDSINGAKRESRKLSSPGNGHQYYRPR